MRTEHLYFIVDNFSKLPMMDIADNPHAGCLLHSLDPATSEHDGEYIVLCHGAEDGSIIGWFLKMAREHNAKVVACYPKRVQERYPDLDVMGDWDESTGLTFDLRMDDTWAVSPHAA